MVLLNPWVPGTVFCLKGKTVLASLLLPMVFGDAALAHRHGEIGAGPFFWKWHTVLVFEIGVVMIVGGGLTAAALSLWESPVREEK